MSPLRSKADLNTFDNWVKLLHCKGLKDRVYRSFIEVRQVGPAIFRSQPLRKIKRLTNDHSGYGRCIEAFSYFMVSIDAPFASGWSKSCRVGLAPTGKRRLSTAHAHCSHSLHADELLG